MARRSDDIPGIAIALAGRAVLLLGAFEGDGTLPVFGELEGGELARVTIEFGGPESTSSRSRVVAISAQTARLRRLARGRTSSSSGSNRLQTGSVPTSCTRSDHSLWLALRNPLGAA